MGDPLGPFSVPIWDPLGPLESIWAIGDHLSYLGPMVLPGPIQDHLGSLGPIWVDWSPMGPVGPWVLEGGGRLILFILSYKLAHMIRYIILYYSDVIPATSMLLAAWTYPLTYQHVTTSMDMSLALLTCYWLHGHGHVLEVIK